MTDFHKGPVNQLLHAIGIMIMLYAIYTQRISLVVMSITIMEFGHWHQYQKSNDIYKARVKAVLTLQIGLIIAVISVLSIYFYYF